MHPVSARMSEFAEQNATWHADEDLETILSTEDDVNVSYLQTEPAGAELEIAMDSVTAVVSGQYSQNMSVLSGIDVR